MRQELDEKLCRKFPNLYRDRNGRPQDTAMCWGFSCGDGWFEIIRDLSRKITELDPNCVALQVKEKFGSLCFYEDDTTDEVHDAIEEAERKSAKTCEMCGQPGKIRGKMWLKCTCDKCEEERNNVS